MLLHFFLVLQQLATQCLYAAIDGLFIDRSRFLCDKNILWHMHRYLCKLIFFKVIFLMIKNNMAAYNTRIYSYKSAYCVPGILFYVGMITGMA